MPLKPAGRGFRIEGAKEVEVVLRRLPNQVRGRVLRAVAMSGARVLRDAARQNAPVESGTLRESIVARGERRAGRHEVRVKVGPLRTAFYGLFQEFGTSRLAARPWLRPAFEASKVEALRRIGAALGPAIERAAKRLAGPLSRSGLVRRTGRRGRR